MTWSNPLFLIPMTTGPFLILAGIIMRFWPPKKINSLYGYRTPKSMKNQTNWDFSQVYSAKRLIWVGVVYLASSALSIAIQISEGWSVFMSLSILLLIIGVLVIDVELALKKFENESE